MKKQDCNTELKNGIKLIKVCALILISVYINMQIGASRADPMVLLVSDLFVVFASVVGGVVLLKIKEESEDK